MCSLIFLCTVQFRATKCGVFGPHVNTVIELRQNGRGMSLRSFTNGSLFVHDSILIHTNCRRTWHFWTEPAPVASCVVHYELKMTLYPNGQQFAVTQTWIQGWPGVATKYVAILIFRQQKSDTIQRWGFAGSAGHWLLNHLHGYISISSRFGHAGSLWAGHKEWWWWMVMMMMRVG